MIVCDFSFSRIQISSDSKSFPSIGSLIVTINFYVIGIRVGMSNLQHFFGERECV